MTQRVPLMLIPLGIAKKISKRLRGIGTVFTKFVPGLKYDLEKTDIELTQEEYIAVCLVNCLVIFLIFSVLLFFIFYIIRTKTLSQSLILSIGIGLIFFILFLFLLARYPKILAKKKAEKLEKNLVFALKDILLEISSGVSLYNALVNVSKANYGLVSNEIEKTAKQVNSGKAMDKALEELAVTSESEYLRKTVWQLINTLRAGASLKGALKTIIKSLTIDQKTKIRDYAKELNMWSLIYMLFAVAIPTIGTTMIVILSSFAGMGVSRGFFIAFIIICFIVQFILIGLIKTRRPMVYI
ncbi:type II secretion system F family protein [Candidatus Woesearchaeota archaeon]|nr:type II secretion system F family protein [Candidatus Woesearchaeota archaeon]